MRLRLRRAAGGCIDYPRRAVGAAAQPVAAMGRELPSAFVVAGPAAGSVWSEPLRVNRKGRAAGRRRDWASRSSCWRGTRTLRFCPEPRPRRQGASDPSAAAEAVVGPAQATLDQAADPRGVADQTARSARSVSQGLARGRGRGGRSQCHVQLLPVSREATASDRAKAGSLYAIIWSMKTRLSHEA
jgi:hypothetical protein